MQSSLFKSSPLSDRFRPSSFDEFYGQKHLVSSGSFFRKAIENDNLSSMIFWGPPGVGKTSLAKLIAIISKRSFISFSAVLGGVKDIREIVKKAKDQISINGINIIVFIDEIHRFNKAQQDALLPHVEDGTITLIGATTENPSFEINSALLSRTQVYVLKSIEDEEISKFIDEVLFDKAKGLGSFNLKINQEAKNYLINISNGDLRTVLNTLELSAISIDKTSLKEIDLSLIKQVLSSRKISYDKGGEEHYNLISALHKSMRGSSVDGSLYWLSRMIQGGCDPMYLARRLVRFASEDVGLADPQALTQAIACKEAVHFLGYPECNTALAQCVIYLSTSPKSNSVYKAINMAKKSVYETKNEDVPLHLRNAPTSLMKDLDYGKDYIYDHNWEYSFSGQNFLPSSVKALKLYSPGKFGYEKEIKKRLDFWENLKKTRK